MLLLTVISVERCIIRHMQYSHRVNTLSLIARTILELIIFPHRVQAVLVNRLVLNLCSSVHMEEDRATFASVTGLRAPNFATNPMLGNLGAPLRTNYDLRDQPDCLSPPRSNVMNESDTQASQRP